MDLRTMSELGAGLVGWWRRVVGWGRRWPARREGSCLGREPRAAQCPWLKAAPARWRAGGIRSRDGGAGRPSTTATEGQGTLTPERARAGPTFTTPPSFSAGVASPSRQYGFIILLFGVPPRTRPDFLLDPRTDDVSLTHQVHRAGPRGPPLLGTGSVRTEPPPVAQRAPPPTSIGRARIQCRARVTCTRLGDSTASGSRDTPI